MNTQAPEKVITSSTLNVLQVHSVFKTIQGEGPYSGRPAIFVRLAGCNLQCPGCDTDYTSNVVSLTVGELYGAITHKEVKGPRLVVITGGEPFRQNITPICKLLLKAGFHVQVETNGTLPPSPEFPSSATIVCSPKSGTVNSRLARQVDCYKYVMHADSVDPKDGLPILALDHSAKPKVARPCFSKEIYLQPMDSQDPVQNELNLQAVLKSCLKYGYTLQLQIHKLIGVE